MNSYIKSMFRNASVNDNEFFSNGTTFLHLMQQSKVILINMKSDGKKKQNVNTLL